MPLPKNFKNPAQQAMLEQVRSAGAVLRAVEDAIGLEIMASGQPITDEQRVRLAAATQEFETVKKNTGQYE
jgi:hypothetical protein